MNGVGVSWLGRAFEVSALLFLLGCSTGLPQRSEYSGSGRRVSLDNVPVHGFRAGIRLADDEAISGELLAVDHDKLWVQLDPRSAREESEPAVVVIPHLRIVEVAVELRSSRVGAYSVWTTFGALSTISNGAWALFTTPAWLAGGTTLASIDGVEAWGRVRPPELWRLSEYSRFPAGPPAHLTVFVDTGAEGLTAPEPPGDLPPLPPPPH